MKRRKISVFGLGYVGSISAACFAGEGMSVIGVDVSQTKVDLINSGKSPVIEAGLTDLIKENVDSGRLRATSNYRQAIEESEISFVCVGTPCQSIGNVDLSYIWNVCEKIGHELESKEDFHVIVIRSTVPPGTLKKCADIVEKVSRKTCGRDFGICANPEFLREGSSLKDFYNPPYTLVGASDERTEKCLSDIYSFLDAPLLSTEVGVAEIMKYVNNVWHALKVSYANEIGNICKMYGIDSRKVMEIFCRDKKLNISSYYMKPGFAFGGSCLPKDVRGLARISFTLGLPSPVISSIMESNKAHLERIFDRILSNGKRHITVLGLSFKEGTDDLRESPSVELVEKLLGKGCKIRIYDKSVHAAQLLGANKEYIEEHIPHIAELLTETIEEGVEGAEVVVVANGSDEFSSILEQLPEDVVVFDLIGTTSDLSDRENYEGACW